MRARGRPAARRRSHDVPVSLNRQFVAARVGFVEASDFIPTWALFTLFATTTPASTWKNAATAYRVYDFNNRFICILRFIDRYAYCYINIFSHKHWLTFGSVQKTTKILLAFINNMNCLCSQAICRHPSYFDKAWLKICISSIQNSN